jgi:hypothetical protein
MKPAAPPLALALALLACLLAPPAVANDKLVCVSTLCTRTYADLGCVARLGAEGAPLSGSYGVAVCPATDASATTGFEVMVCAGQPGNVCNHLDVVQQGGLVCVEDFGNPTKPPVTLACVP